MKQRMNGISILGIITFFVFSSHLLTRLLENPDIWWSPEGLYASLDDARDRVRLFIAAKPVEQHISEGTLSYASIDGEQMPVTYDDVRLRMNNWDRRRAQLYGAGMFQASLATAGLMLVIFGMFVIPLMSGKRRKDEESVSPEQEKSNEA